MKEPGARVLVLTPIGRDGVASAELLSRAGLPAHLCSSFTDLTEELAHGAAAVFVAEEALFGQDLGPLEQWLASQPPWSDLPFILLTSHRQDPRVAAWRQKLVGRLGNAALLERPVQPITLTSTVQAAVRARHRQYEVRSLLAARERSAEQLQQKVDEATAELRQQMANRARMEDALRQAQKMEAIGQLTGGVAHDFNNLLMVITAGLEMIERDPGSSRVPAFIEGMRNAAQRGAALTRQLLGFARRQPLKPQPIDLESHVGGMRELLDRSLGGTIDLRADFAPDLWPVAVDPSEFELVVLNLAFNARDAMPGGGTITLLGRNLPGAAGKGDFVQLTVADTGTGMPPDVAARAFEPFFTTKEIGKGSGLGLAQAYGFARESGGTVHIDSEVGRGTRIVLTLPRSFDAPLALDGRHVNGVRAGTRKPNSSEAGGGRVLLVEDDEEVARLVSEMLDQLGYDVLRTAGASAALGALANGRAIDIVFSDIMMPGEMDGVGLAREVKARRPELPVLLTSGHSAIAHRDIEAEGLTVLAKPYRLEDLRAALAGALRRAHAPPAP
ncbi:MAG: response regulator [Enhydrobacter sp.]|nr:response regulator [Enhydrobacter sp.]